MKLDYCVNCKFRCGLNCIKSPLSCKSIDLVEACFIRQINQEICKHKNIIATKDVFFKTDTNIYNTTKAIAIVCDDCGKLFNVYMEEVKDESI